jgi:hypothetical protein
VETAFGIFILSINNYAIVKLVMENYMLLVSMVLLNKENMIEVAKYDPIFHSCTEKTVKFLYAVGTNNEKGSLL